MGGNASWNLLQPETWNRLVQVFQRFEDLLVCGPHFVIDLDKFPSNESLLVDHIGCRMRQSLAAFVENAVAIDNLVPAIGKKNNLVGFSIIAGNGFVGFGQIFRRFIGNNNNLNIRKRRIRKK